jgi:hypothetical protein
MAAVPGVPDPPPQQRVAWASGPRTEGGKFRRSRRGGPSMANDYIPRGDEQEN